MQRGWYTIRTDYSFFHLLPRKLVIHTPMAELPYSLIPQTRHSFNCNHGIYPSIFHSIGLHPLICFWRNSSCTIRFMDHPSSDCKRQRGDKSSLQHAVVGWEGGVAGWGWDGGDGLVWLLSLPVSSDSCLCSVLSNSL